MRKGGSDGGRTRKEREQRREGGRTRKEREQRREGGRTRKERRKALKRTIPPLWVKFLWFWPVFWIVLDEVNGELDSCSLRNGDSVDLNGLLSKT